MAAQDAPRQQIWEYYDRRARQGARTFGHALDYWNGLGVETTATAIEAESREVKRLIRALGPRSFVELGAGPGTFTAELPGWGVAIDQSEAALRILRSGRAETPVIRADAVGLPLPDQAVGRAFATHLYGLLPPTERWGLVREAHRVASELAVVDAGRPDGVPAEHWQHRTLPSGGVFRIYRRHFDASELADELDGRAVFAGRFYVLVTA